MIVTKPLEITTTDGRATGRWRCVEVSDEHDGVEPLCDCGGRASDNPTTCGHESPEAARACPVASRKIEERTLGRVAADERVHDLARVAFEAYGASTGGKTWDGKPIPPFDAVCERTPHVAEAWRAAVRAVLKAGVR
jgi:hypothetical protein